jgi:ParB-like chromosome segregation protein Spo0J
MENIVRDDLNAVDRAAALRALKVQLGDVPWETVAEAVGIRRSRLFQLLGTEKLPDAAREDLRSGRLNEKQSRALQGLPPIQQDVLREAIVADEIPATEAMRLAKALRGARLPDDRETVTKAFAAIREGAARPATAGSASGLLALVSTGLTGSRVERAALAETIDALGAPRLLLPTDSKPTSMRLPKCLPGCLGRKQDLAGRSTPPSSPWPARWT